MKDLVYSNVGTYFDRVLCVRIGVGSHLEEEVLAQSERRGDSSSQKNSALRREMRSRSPWYDSLIGSFVLLAHHGVGLARASLAVGEDAHVVAWGRMKDVERSWDADEHRGRKLKYFISSFESYLRKHVRAFPLPSPDKPCPAHEIQDRWAEGKAEQVH